MPSPETRSIPFGAQFSPKRTALPPLVLFVEKFAGHEADLNQAIQAAFFREGDGDEYNRREEAKHMLLVLRNYGIFSAHAKEVLFPHDEVRRRQYRPDGPAAWTPTAQFHLVPQGVRLQRLTSTDI